MADDEDDELETLSAADEDESGASFAPDGLDVPAIRRGSLAGFVRLATDQLAKHPQWNAVSLTCSQYYADEAGDAVHDSVTASESHWPTAEDVEEYDRIPWDARGPLDWDENGLAVYAFAPLCNEEGYSDEEDDYSEGGVPSSLAIVQRIDGELRATYTGTLHRAWLDFPGALHDREDWADGATFVPEPAPAELVGKEADVHAQVLADPANLGIRDVLRDLWIQRDDPRGEFATLTAQASLTAEQRARAAALVAAHGRSWLGPLTKVIPLSGALFANGPFVRDAYVYFASEDRFRAVATAFAWATVESLTFTNQSFRRLSPAMKNLRAVGPITLAELAASSGTWPIHDLHLDLVADGAGPEDLAKLAARPEPITTLRLSITENFDVAALHALPLAKLSRLELWLGRSAIDQIPPLFASAAQLVPPTCTVGVGQLLGGYRRGWLLAGSAKERGLEMSIPDVRYEQGRQLAKAAGSLFSKVKVPTTWPAGPDWLTFGLGVAIVPA